MYSSQVNMMNKPLWHNGPQPGNFYNFPNNTIENAPALMDPQGVQRTS